jgi:trehalose 6-phosphate synthase
MTSRPVPGPSDALPSLFGSPPTVAVGARPQSVPLSGARPRRSTPSNGRPGNGASPADGAGPDGAMGSGRLVVVSNRVPVPSDGARSSAGGLAVALEAALKARGGLWFGWSGKTGESDPDALDVIQAGPVTFAVSDLSKRDIDEYYSGFANQALWPICHYRLDLARFDRRFAAAYFRVNEFFAYKLARLLRPDDVVWIHDYHFIPLAATLRQMGFANRIGFFLHIPWPPSDVASALPVYETLLRSFAAYDLIGFHTPQDAENFGGCLAREGTGTPLGDGYYEALGRVVRVGAFPVSIDTEGFRRTAANADRTAVVRRANESLGGRKLIIGVDRLDYSKGILHRVEAFCSFIAAHSEARNRVTYFQITPKSRSDVPQYKQMQREIAERIGATNGNYGEIDWVPIRYINKAIGHSALAGLYRLARVGLVTPLRDGMNLVAKEFVAAQEEDDPGVLVLSRFAGACHELDGALLVNPYDIEGTAAAIARALAMPLEERRERWTGMFRHLQHNTAQHWADTFIEALTEFEPSLAAAAVDDIGFVAPEASGALTHSTH